MESRRLILSVSFIITAVSFAISQPINVGYLKHAETQLTKNPYLDSFRDKDQVLADPFEFFKDEPKSPLKAAIFSAVLPGAGEWYTESYKSAIGFFAAEVVFIGAYLYYDSEAISQEKAYQKVANDPINGWSVRKYADYLIDLAQTSGAQDQKAKDLAESLYSRINSESDQTPGNRAWWNELNALEREMVFEYGGRAKFSHVLPTYNSQQYYELIGKYNQFNPGWSDFTDASKMENPTPFYISYRNMRTKANDMHNTAYTYLVLTVMNHSVSAINAAIQAHLHNQNLQLSLGSLPSGDGTRTPALNISLKL
ncbi:MAG: hypothetical protein J0L62_02285 [Bacteroidetes bacterium]|nr:hypothetical protein [Bacteroidota bacterium]